MPFGIGHWELLALAVVLLLLFGARRLPEIGRAAGKAVREVRGTLDVVREDPAPHDADPARAERKPS